MELSRLPLLVLLLLVATARSQAQTAADSLQPAELSEQYDELLQEVRYEKNTRKLLPKKFKKRQIEEEVERRDAPDLSFLNGALYRWIMYVLIAALVLVILYVLLQNVQLNQGNEELPSAAVTDDEIDDIEAVDTDGGYEDAMAAGDYRRACRMVFLKVLQHLESTERIRWKKEKTNRHYLREMSEDKQLSEFRSLVNVYEKVWYGNKPIDRTGIVDYAGQAAHIIPIKLPAYE